METQKKHCQVKPRVMRRLAECKSDHGTALAELEREDPALTPLLVNMASRFLTSPAPGK